MNAQAPTAAGSASRTLLLIGLGIVGLAIATVLVVLLAGDRRAAEFSSDSPEGTLQRYLIAYDSGDLDAAHAFFSAEVRERMDAEAYERAVDSFWHDPASGGRSVLFDSTDGNGDRVELHLIVEEFYGDGFSGETYRSPRDIRLVREDGEWRIDQPLVWLDPAPIEATR